MPFSLHRRRFLKSLVALGGLAALAPERMLAAQDPRLMRAIPSSGQRIPAIGMGSWLTFDVEGDEDALRQRVEVSRNFFDMGGRLIDSSPMYGSSQETIGECLRRLDYPSSLFAATKVWTWGRRVGEIEMENSRGLWGVRRFQLMQVHNLLDWETHIETLKAWKAEGRIAYLGVTTSHGRRHEELIKIMKTQPLDFVQFTYNIADREAERVLLPLAAERGIGVIVNRPFQRGALFARVAAKPLPPWAAEIACSNWARYFLKFILSHPAVTCAIPATSRPDHMSENMGALYGPLPDGAMRKKMIDYFLE